MMDDFDLASAASRDEAQLTIKHPSTGNATTWIWTFYGPGHPKTIEVANRAARDMLRESKTQQEARINGKKWKAEDQTIDDLREKNVENIIGRTKEFTPVKMADEVISFSPEAARKLLLDRKMGWLLGQVIDFLKEEESFIQPSALS